MLLCKQISIFFSSMLRSQVHLSLFYYFLKNKFYYSLSWLTFKIFDPLSLSLKFKHLKFQIILSISDAASLPLRCGGRLGLVVGWVPLRLSLSLSPSQIRWWIGSGGLIWVPLRQWRSQEFIIPGTSIK
jgi:hypothetical protein